MRHWAIITGGGTGIGAALAHHLAAQHHLQVLIIGRRLKPLTDTKGESSNISILQGDISKEETIDNIDKAIPSEDAIKFLVQNAAIGEPSKLGEIDPEHLDYAFRVNVTAPLMLVQKLLPRMKESTSARILHVGTAVAFMPQLGTATYGITKLAFHRLYEQLKVEVSESSVRVGSARPGVVDTEGLWHHYTLASNLQLPHTAYFDQVKQDNQIWSGEESARFLSFLLCGTADSEYSDKEWAMNDESHWPRWKHT